MAKEVEGLIKLQIRGGAANPSPPLQTGLGLQMKKHYYSIETIDLLIK